MAADFYVRVGGNDSNNGASWSTAVATVEAALDLANADDTIRVAAGVYLPTFQPGISPRSKTFQLTGDGLTLRGGFPANPTGSPAQNPSLYETILSGDLAADDATVGTDENVFHVVSFIGADENMLLDGFVVEAGNAGADSTSTSGTDIRGGGVYMTHDWTESGSPCLGVVQNCTIRKNEGRYGGGLVVDGEKPTGTPGSFSFPVARPTIRTTLVRDNTSWKGGGGMHWIDAAPEAAGCVVVENFCDFFAGGIEIERPVEPTGSVPPTTIVNRTVAFNENDEVTGSLGAGIRVIEADEEDIVVIESSIITNNISGSVSSNSAAQVQGQTNVGSLVFTINHTCIADLTAFEATQFGVGNIGDTDPFFSDPQAGDYRLRRCSPCVDTGTNTASDLPDDTYDADYDLDTTEVMPDRDRATRIMFGRVDMGAFERQTAFTCLGDLDLDADVGVSDLAILLGAWGAGCSGAACDADLDCDGDVGTSDLALLLGAWGACPEGDSEGLLGGESSQASATIGLFSTPSELAAALGFESIEALAQWLGSLSEQDRSAILLGLIGGAS